MHTHLRCFFIAAITVTLITPIDAQFKKQGWGGGIAGGVTAGHTSLKDDQFSFMGRAFLRHGIVNHLQAEVGAGGGRIEGTGRSAGSKYSTDLLPVDIRLLYNPFTWESVVPYVYAGGGMLLFDVTKLPLEKTRGADRTDWTGYVPVGVGMMFHLAGNLYLDVNGGFNHTLTKQITGVKVRTEDDYFTGLAGLSLSMDRGKMDDDGDGLTNNQEEALGTNPDLADTDGDGLSDGAEVNVHRTSPLKADSDGDGLTDGDEVEKYKTDANKADTDGDGLTDQAEVMTHRTDPLKVDSDGDGLSDDLELKQYKTNPSKADTDGDGLTDGNEVKTHHTDPLKPDTDNDTLSDGDEITKYKTNPLTADTDSGTIDDGVEITRGTDPLNAADDVPKKELKVEVGTPIVLEGIVFASGKSTITPESEEKIELAYNTLKGNPDIEVEIHGYTDNVGKASSNLKLSTARANAVREFLIKKGIDGKRIKAKGFGVLNPIAPNNTPEGRQENRRIEFLRTK